MRGFSVFTVFAATDGMTPVFNKMTLSAGTFEGKLSQASRRLKKDFTELKTSIMSMGTGLGALAFATPFKTFADWEKGILGVETLISKSEIAEYGKKIEGVSRSAIKSNFAIDDTNKALFDTVSALGISDKSLSVFKDSTMLAKSGLAELSVTVDGMTSVMNAYGKETTDTYHVANAFFTSQRFGKTTVAELSSNIGKVAPIAKAADIGYKELLATMASLTLGGLATDEATTALRGTLSALIKPTKEASDVMSQLGIPYGVTAIRAKGLRYTLEKLNEAQKKNPDLMSKAIPNIRAYTAAMALSEDKLQMIDKIMHTIEDDIKNGTGLKEAFELMTNSSSAAVGKMTGSLTDATIGLGKALAPTLIPVIQAITGLTDKISKIDPQKLQFFGTVALYAFAARPAIMGVKVAFDLLTVATTAYGAFSVGLVKTLTTTWKAGGSTISGVLKMLGTNMLLTAKTGIGSMITALTALNWVTVGTIALVSGVILVIGGAFIYFYNHSEKFRTVVDKAVNGVVSAFKWLGNTVFGIIKTIYEAWNTLWAWLTNSEPIKVKADLTGFDRRTERDPDDFDFPGIGSHNPLHPDIFEQLVDKEQKKNRLDITINNNTPYPMNTQSSLGDGYHMKLNGNEEQ